MWAILILAGVGLWLFLAVRAMKYGKTGGCSGNCAHCANSCKQSEN